MVAPWLQNSSKPQIIHGISGIPTQYLVLKEKQPYKIQYSLKCTPCQGHLVFYFLKIWTLSFSRIPGFVQ